MRNLAVTRSRRASSSEVLSDDVAVFEDGTRAPADPMSRQTEISMMRQAFAALPRRWQVILWRTAVDHDRNIEIGHDLGISPNAVAALAKRARRGLRQAYLQVHLSTNGLDPGCEPFVRRLPMLAIEGAIPPDDLARHLATCPTCPGRLAELQRVEQQLGSMLGPAVLLTAPGFLAPALAGTVGAATGGTAAAAGTAGGAAGGSAAGGSAAGGTAAGGTGSSASTSSLVAKLTAGKIAATAVGAVAAVSAGLLISRDDPPPRPPATQQSPTSTPSETSTADPTTPTPTQTTPRTTTRTPPPPRTTTPEPAPPVDKPSPTPSSTPPPKTTTPVPTPTTTVATTPLRVGMGIAGTADATRIDVHAESRGTTGVLQLTLRGACRCHPRQRVRRLALVRAERSSSSRAPLGPRRVAGRAPSSRAGPTTPPVGSPPRWGRPTAAEAT